jgi:hypothetical protein
MLTPLSPHEIRHATISMNSGGSSEFNKNRAARKPGPMDRVVELQKPLGIVLEEDEKGNVYVKELSPAGNAARVRLVCFSMSPSSSSLTHSPTHLAYIHSRARSKRATW